MKWSSIGVKLAGLAAGFLLVGMIGGSASAYPPPTGSVSMSTSVLNPTPGSSVAVSTTVLNQFGSPAFGQSCTFSIVSQPGTGATVDAGPFVTNDAGVVSTTLNVGTTAGTVVVGANCGTTLSGQISVSVQGAATGTTVRMPATGTGPERGFDGLSMVMALLATGLVCVSGSGLLVSIRRRA